VVESGGEQSNPLNRINLETMPTFKYEFIVNGKVDYTCYTQTQSDFYQNCLEFDGVDYIILKTSLY
jgi:hypothetical protein